MVALEAAVVAAGGAVLGWLAGLPLDVELWTASVAGLNGLISGARSVYDWRRPGGWAGFLLDSTWGLVGTFGSVVLHAVQTLLPAAGYRADLSRRRGRHIYAGGYRIDRRFATAIGNTVTNAAGTTGLDGPGGPRRRLLIDRHEMLHVWQHRLFGPVFPTLYLLWAAVGAMAGVIVGAVTRRPIGRSVFTVAYADNPFEYWAYRRDRYWPPAGADPSLAWPGRLEDPRRDRLV